VYSPLKSFTDHAVFLSSGLYDATRRKTKRFCSGSRALQRAVSISRYTILLLHALAKSHLDHKTACRKETWLLIVLQDWWN